MAIKDWMSNQVITVNPETKIFAAADLMKEHDIHRLPVVANGKMVGLITEGVIHEATPSKATSLSVYEMNYLLNKTTVADVMIKEVLTVNPSDVLEEAVYKMKKYNVGVLPVLDQGKLVGIITDKDIFGAFLQISAYGTPGLRVLIMLHNDTPGQLAQVLQKIADLDINVVTAMVDREDDHDILVQIQLLTTDLTVVDQLKAQNIEVLEAVVTN